MKHRSYIILSLLTLATLSIAQDQRETSAKTQERITREVRHELLMLPYLPNWYNWSERIRLRRCQNGRNRGAKAREKSSRCSKPFETPCGNPSEKSKKKYQLSSPKIVRDPWGQRLPFSVRLTPTIVGGDEYMELST